MGKRVIALIFLAAVWPIAAAIQEPIKVEGGLVSGAPGWAWGVRAYLGIPFAAPPVGNLRWQPPQPVHPWQGVLAANQFSPACMQAAPANSNPGTIRRSEDCLYLNVWTPAVSASQRLPVLVWIYGGGGTAGSNAEPIYDGNALAKKGVVVVSANYRVNVFGWFAHPELTRESAHHSSGNYGAHDQLAALRWVKNNIAQFGGDPNKVTMFGESGGSRSVNWLAASPLVNGLVQGAIGESHTVFGRMMTIREAEHMGSEFSSTIGLPSLAALRSMPAQDLFDASVRIPAATNGTVVDGWFLPQDIYTIYSQGMQNDISLITGVTNDEGGSIGAPGAARGTGSGLASAAPDSRATYTAWVKERFGNRAGDILRLYPAGSDAEAAKAYHDVYRDINFAGHRTWARLQVTTGKSPVYIYNFSHNPPRPQGDGNDPLSAVMSSMYTGIFPAVHFSEVIYVFNNLRMKDFPWTDTDRKVADMLSSYWTNFAKTSNPNGPGLPSWPVYDPKDEQWMNFGDAFRLEHFNSAGVDVIAAVQEALRKTP
jgi:para-nitrobenzyl esterase